MSVLFPGYYFRNEINAVPSLEGMARMITRTSNDLVGAISSYFKVNSVELSHILNNVRPLFRAYKLLF